MLLSLHSSNLAVSSLHSPTFKIPVSPSLIPPITCGNTMHALAYSISIASFPTQKFLQAQSKANALAWIGFGVLIVHVPFALALHHWVPMGHRRCSSGIWHYLLGNCFGWKNYQTNYFFSLSKLAAVRQNNIWGEKKGLIFNTVGCTP